ncbi:uncharacterized protein JCM15063_001617 [Sporobolomyces koalae]|uniref:uncharacterized protein n=1 Tax=Sporobolomyces koalae TaxID=500713 RepID=UPI0031791610
MARSNVLDKIRPSSPQKESGATTTRTTSPTKPPVSTSASTLEEAPTRALANDPKFTILIKTTTKRERDHDSTAAASPLPHPLSPSAPASSNLSHSVSPDPNGHVSASTLAAVDAPATTSAIQSSEEKSKKKSKTDKRKNAKPLKSRSNQKPKPDETDTAPVVTTPLSSTKEDTPISTTSSGQVSTTSTKPVSTNRVCHQHKSLTKGEVRMNCSNLPDCRTIWCKNCIEKFYLDLLPSRTFVEGTSFPCPVCTGQCTCASCRRKRKGLAKEARRAEKTNSCNNKGEAVVTAGHASATPDPIIKVEQDEHSQTVIPDSESPPPSSAFANSNVNIDATPLATVTPGQPSGGPSTATPTSGILKIRIKPPKRPRTERGTFGAPDPTASTSTLPYSTPDHPYAGASTDEYSPYTVAPPATPAVTASTRKGRGGARKGAGRRISHAPTPLASPSVQTGFIGNAAMAGYGAVSPFFGSSSSSNVFGGHAPGVGAREIRPKRTKKVSSQYDDFSVEGVPAFEGGEPVPEPTTKGRWGGYRRGAGGKRKIPEGHLHHHPHPLSLPTAETVFASREQPFYIDENGRRRRRRLSGLSSASSCSGMSSVGDDEVDQDDLFESSYWQAQEESRLERDTDERVRHWLLVPPDEPQPVLAGLERNLTEPVERDEDDVAAFSPKSLRKEKVKWIEGPERRRRRALALKKLREEEDAQFKGISQGIVKEEAIDADSDDGSRRSLKRSASWDPIDSKDLTSTQDGQSSIPTRPSSAPILSSKLEACGTLNAAVQTDGHLSPPSPFRSHFPPTVTDPLPLPHSYEPPAIVVSPATTAAPSPQPPSAPASGHPTPELSVTQPDVDADLAARSADDKRLGLRLLDAIRTITGTKLAMEAMGLASSAVSSAVSSAASVPTPVPAARVTSATTSRPTQTSSLAATAPPPPPPPSDRATSTNVTSSPVKLSQGSSDDGVTFASALISQEHAEHEALRREERHRLLTTALDPRKVFRAEAKDNDVHLLEFDTVSGWEKMDVDTEETPAFKLEYPEESPSFDFESFLVTDLSPRTESFSQVVTNGLSVPRPLINPPETLSKPLHSSHLVVPTCSPNPDDTNPWTVPCPAGSNHLHRSNGGAATPTRGLVMELDFDFEGIGGGQDWTR